MSPVVKNNFDDLTLFLNENKYDQIFVLVDQNTKLHCYYLIEQIVPNALLIEVEAGEKSKQINTCFQVWEQLSLHLASRHALLINLGGGMISDLGGFVASTYKRGIDFINIPTSLLAMVDASIGGKTGIDFQGIKNMIGLIVQPKLILTNPIFLKTLAPRQIRSGYAEMLKHGMIADRKYLQALMTVNIEEIEDWAFLIQKSIDIKKRIVDQDPTEQGLRKILNFGHSIGHALESCFLEDTADELFHGEAVAWGMVVESFLSTKVLGFQLNDFSQFYNFIQKNYSAVKLSTVDVNKVFVLLQQDKKNTGSLINFVLLQEIGKAQFDISCNEDLIKDALKTLYQFNQ